MDLAIIAIILAIAATAAYSAWKQLLYSVFASIACVFAFIVMALVIESEDPYFDYELAFAPMDLYTADRVYTVLTSMFAHGGLFHLLFNVLGLIFIGMLFEQRIGTRPFMLLYFLCGLAGTLAFAIVHWGEVAYVLGASGAISGILGGFARMFPNERMSMFVMFFPLPPLPIWVIVVIFVFLQILLIPGYSGIAWEAHLGGLAAGILLTPVVVKVPLHKRVKRMVSLSALRKLATTQELKTILRRIEDEEVPDVRSAWIEHYLIRARCPYCGSRLKVTSEAVVCEKGHLI